MEPRHPCSFSYVYYNVIIKTDYKIEYNITIAVSLVVLKFKIWGGGEEA